MNGCSYRVIYCTPRPGADERVNIGVVVLEGRKSYVQFGTNIKALRVLAPDVERHAQRIQRQVTRDIEAIQEGLEVSGDSLRYGLRYLNELVQGPSVMNISDERPIALAAEEAIKLLSTVYLAGVLTAGSQSVGPMTIDHKLHGKEAVVRFTRRKLKAAVSNMAPQSHLKIVDSSEAVLQGLGKDQYFHFGIKNGTLRSAGFGIDLDLDSADYVRRSLDAFAKAVEEVHQKSPDIPLVVVASSEREDRQLLKERAESYFRGYASLVNPNEQLSEWADEVIKEIIRAA